MDLADRKLWIAGALVAVAVACYVLAGGRKGAAELRQDVDDAARGFTGQQAVQCGEELKADIRATSREWFGRVREAERREE